MNIKLNKKEIMVILYLLNQEIYSNNKNEKIETDVKKLIRKLEDKYFNFIEK